MLHKLWNKKIHLDFVFLMRGRHLFIKHDGGTLERHKRFEKRKMWPNKNRYQWERIIRTWNPCGGTKKMSGLNWNSIMGNHWNHINKIRNFKRNILNISIWSEKCKTQRSPSSIKNQSSSIIDHFDKDLDKERGKDLWL